MSDHASWSGFSAFQVFGDHVPMAGFQIVLRIVAEPAPLDRLIERRAGRSEVLDPELAKAVVRAGLGLMRSGAVSFLHASPDEVIALLKPEAVREAGQSLEVHDQLVSLFAARLALLAGTELPARAAVYEFPDLGVARRAFVAGLEALADSVASRCSRRLGAQMRGRGEPFHPSMLDTHDDQIGLLEDRGVDVRQLPGWWTRGVAARHGNGQVEVLDDLPTGAAFGELVG